LCLGSPALNALALEIQKGLNELVSKQILTESQIPVAVFLREGLDGLGGIFVCDAPLPDAAWQWLETLVESENILGFGTRIRSQKSNSIVGGQLDKSIGSLWVLPLEGGPEVHIDTFCQANPAIAQKLYRDVAHFMVGDGTANEFLDLYAGNGGFSNALKRRGATQITAVESHPLCEQPLKTVGSQVQMESAEAWLEHNPHSSFDALVADPPKKGLGHVASQIAQLHTPRVALVFCNPDAIAKDVPEFLKAGYRICAVVPYDLFGGTPEVETVVYLTKDCNV
jgi:hypothetical protein